MIDYGARDQWKWYTSIDMISNRRYLQMGKRMRKHQNKFCFQKRVIRDTDYLMTEAFGSQAGASDSFVAGWKNQKKHKICMLQTISYHKTSILWQTALSTLVRKSNLTFFYLLFAVSIHMYHINFLK